MVRIAYTFRDLKNLRGIVYFSESGEYHGVMLTYSRNGALQEILYFLEGNKVEKEEYAEAQKKDGTLPPLYDNAQNYKKLLSQEIKGLLESYKAIEPVIIPLQFDKEGRLLTKSGRPFVLPINK